MPSENATLGGSMFRALIAAGLLAASTSIAAAESVKLAVTDRLRARVQ